MVPQWSAKKGSWCWDGCWTHGSHWILEEPHPLTSGASSENRGRSHHLSFTRCCSQPHPSGQAAHWDTISNVAVLLCEDVSRRCHSCTHRKPLYVLNPFTGVLSHLIVTNGSRAQTILEMIRSGPACPHVAVRRLHHDAAIGMGWRKS